VVARRKIGAPWPAEQEPVEQKLKLGGRKTMTTRHFLLALGLAAPLALGLPSAHAEDQLKVAIGQINNWENQAPTLGQDAGIFKKHNLVLENVGTQGAGETIQAVISGSADLGAGVGVAGVMRAFSKGAPVRILLPAFTGTGDLYWYVKADSPIKSLKDATAKNTIAFSTSGSSSNNIVLAFVNELGVKATPTKTGGPPATLTAVMSGQVDIGWAAPPFGLQEEKDGKIRIIARGSDVPSLKGQTVRTIIVNANALKDKHDAIMRFVQAYRESVDWMYSDPKAIEMYSAKIKRPVDLLKASIAKYHPKEALQTDHMADLDGAVRDAVKLKFLDKPLTKEQLAELLQIPPRKK
jgi:NitT/TauT family transport system substrate-binding protein